MTPGRRRLLAGLAIALGAGLVAGCSSTDTKNDYVDTVNEIQGSALEALEATADATPENKGALVEQLESGAAALAEEVTELETVDVPDEAQDSHPQLVAGFDKLRALFEESADEARSAGSTKAAFDVVTDLGSNGQEIGTEIDEAITRINEDLGAD